MAKFGGFGTFPLRLGGSVPNEKILSDALNEARGTALDTTTTSPVWAENLAIARALDSIWSANELLGHQATPLKLSVTLARWEKILGVVPSPFATLAQRRQTLNALVSRTGATPTTQQVQDLLAGIIAPVTCTIVHNAPGGTNVLSSWQGGWYVQSVGTTPPAVALTGIPLSAHAVQIRITTGGSLGVAQFVYSLNGGVSFSLPMATAASVALEANSIPLTAAFASGTYATDNVYYASIIPGGFTTAVESIAIVCTKPSWMTMGAYYQALAPAITLLDSFLPAWVYFEMVLDGPNGAGFYLDEVDLDLERFD